MIDYSQRQRSARFLGADQPMGGGKSLPSFIDGRETTGDDEGCPYQQTDYVRISDDTIEFGYARRNDADANRTDWSCDRVEKSHSFEFTINKLTGAARYDLSDSSWKGTHYSLSCDVYQGPKIPDAGSSASTDARAAHDAMKVLSNPAAALPPKPAEAPAPAYKPAERRDLDRLIDNAR